MKILMIVMLLSISSLAIAGGLARKPYSSAELQEYKERVVAETKQHESEQRERDRERNNSQPQSMSVPSGGYGKVVH
ncbi:MAG: hypothetical protein Q8N30_04975 [Methylococcales bacterium]|jgi:hypothetical protein|nr:hypothetical protein [Methylococcales bacterium]